MNNREADTTVGESPPPRSAPPSVPSPIGPSPTDRVDKLLDLVREHADSAVVERSPSRTVMEAFAEVGLLRLLAPRAYGGEEVTLRTFLDVVRAVARIDGSVAWTLMTCNEEMGIASAYLPADTLTLLLRTQPDVIVSGSGLTVGKAVRATTDDGWSVSGRWRFVTGSPAADRIVLGLTIDKPSPMRVGFILVPAQQVTIEDTWHVAGLAGTGSCDVVLTDHFVPDEWTGVHPLDTASVPDVAFYRLPRGLRFPFPKVAVACGIASAAIDSFVELATTKKPAVTRGLLRDRPTAQLALAEAEAQLNAGWHGALAVLDELWETVAANRPIPAALHARSRLMCSYAVRNAIAATELVCEAAGSTANFKDAPFARQLADVRAVSQHFMVAHYQMATAGRVLLGLDADDPAF